MRSKHQSTPSFGGLRLGFGGGARPQVVAGSTEERGRGAAPSLCCCLLYWMWPAATRGAMQRTL